MASYIPSDELGKIQWLTNFAAWLSANGTGYGFAAADMFDFNNAVTTASQAVTNNTTQQAAARATTATKNIALGRAIALGRDNAQRLQAWPGTTDTDRAAAGITIPDTQPTPTPADMIMSVHSPLIDLDFSVRRQVTIHWGPSPTNEHQNARPAGTIGCQIQFARGGIPADEAQWTALEVDTESPLLHIINETTPTTYAYRARYVSKHVRFGPFCDPVVCTVTV